MLNREFVFILENGKTTLALNLNNFNTIDFDDAKRTIVVDHGTSERSLDFDDKESYMSLKEQIITALAGEEE